MQNRDIFICHASEDKDEIVRPMLEALRQANITCWCDVDEIEWGDSITQKVNKGLSISRFVVVVFSPAFIAKNWPQRELNSVLNIEASSGEVKVLPLIVGSKSEKFEILTKYPLLNDKRYLPWDGDLRKIVGALESRLKKEIVVGTSQNSQISSKNVGIRIPLPKIKKKFTQRDKDLFLRESFSSVKAYFKNALTELEQHYQEVQTDFQEVHNLKFICTIYIRGEISNRCKIWISGIISSDCIAYQSGQLNIDSDNSYNELLSIADNEQVLGFSLTNMGYGINQYSGDELHSAEQAAEQLWFRFTDNLG